MDQTAIFQPFIATMILTLAVWVYMYARRLTFIFSSGLAPKQMTPSELARLSPPQVSTPSDNLKNLFELPTIFYAIALTLALMEFGGGINYWLAWGYVGIRIVHSLVQGTINIVPVRLTLFVLSSLCLIGLTTHAGLRILHDCGLIHF